MIQRCSGKECIHRERCLHYLETKKPPRKGKWIRPIDCIDSEWDGDEMTKPPYDKLLLKEKDETKI